ncbi:hypothetical protein BX600DRAFT_436243 [Xylariales sp. PMI_506]|nr:hypothetical protein BX600DRAFT_436243 [Xylariales sp. PMI_506]
MTAAEQQHRPLKKRAVAASFLFRFPTDGSEKVEVALFRRSGKVRTYQYKLSPVSGSVEEDDADPMATALREIKEETTLDLSSIELLQKGKPYTFADESIGREWTINPFAFRLKSVHEGGKGEAGIMIDWEHEGWEWHDPLLVNDSDDFGGVPKLVNSLRRVWPEYDLGPEAGRTLRQGLLDLRHDHESGARQLAAKAVSILREIISKSDPAKIDDIWWGNVCMTAWHLWKNGRESMGAAIVSALVTVLDHIEKALKGQRPSRDKLQEVLQAVDEHLSQREKAVNRIQDAFIDYLRANDTEQNGFQKPLSVLTLSNSSTISSALLGATAALNVTLDLRILESRPLCEGVTLASNLLSKASGNKAVNVTIYSDASAALAADQVDILLLGADRISGAGGVSNKTGSLPAVLSTRHVAPNAKIVVLSEIEKIARPGEMHDHAIEENDPAELSGFWRNDVKGAAIVEERLQELEADKGERAVVKAKNVYFEWIPAEFITAYITDEGLWSVNDITKKSEQVEEEMARFFNDL